jgi:hypothetical protein
VRYVPVTEIAFQHFCMRVGLCNANAAAGASTRERAGMERRRKAYPLVLGALVFKQIRHLFQFGALSLLGGNFSNS